MTPISVLWFWRGLKGHSVTFALLFASLVLGASVSGGVHQALAALGFHWLYVLILPVVLFGWLAKKEAVWLPDQQKRRRIARTMLAVSIALALLIAWLRPARRSLEEPASSQTDQPAVPPNP